MTTKLKYVEFPHLTTTLKRYWPDTGIGICASLILGVWFPSQDAE